MSNFPFDPNSPLFPWHRPSVPAKPVQPSLADLLARALPEPPAPSWANLLVKPKPTRSDLGDLYGKLPLPRMRPRIFVSYQHSSDQYYYNEFSRIFHDGHEAVFDNSLERIIDSEDCEYVIQRIRDGFITGTSCTILLIGPSSYQRKYLDWEIKATLDKEHGLIGIQLPHLPVAFNGQVTVPTRFAENVRSGYALWLHWDRLIAEPHAMTQLIQIASSRDKTRIRNPREIMKRNG